MTRRRFASARSSSTTTRTRSRRRSPTPPATTISPSAFNVARTYINVTGNISHIVVVPHHAGHHARDAAPAAAERQPGLPPQVRLRAVQPRRLDRAAGRQTWVRLGIQQTPFIDSQEGVYRYRFQGTMFAERDGGLSSSDAGASFHTNFPNNYGDVHVGVYNGEGYSRAEPNDQKAFMIRGTVRPLPGRQLRREGPAAHRRSTSATTCVKDAERNRGHRSTCCYEHRWFNAGFDYIADDRSDARRPRRRSTPTAGRSS